MDDFSVVNNDDDDYHYLVCITHEMWVFIIKACFQAGVLSLN